jgi:hypothetical protein
LCDHTGTSILGGLTRTPTFYGTFDESGWWPSLYQVYCPVNSYTSCKHSLHSKDRTIDWRILARTILGVHVRVGLSVHVRVGVSDTMNLGGTEREASLTMRHIVYCSIPLHLSCTSPPPGCSLFELLVFVFGGRCIWVQEWGSARRCGKSVGRVGLTAHFDG